MERVFTDNVRKTNGDIKFRAGETKDYPKDTWDGIARSIDKGLGDFTNEVPQALKDNTAFSQFSSADQAAILASAKAVLTGGNDESKPTSTRKRIAK